jgi:hypothetical protein
VTVDHLNARQFRQDSGRRQPLRMNHQPVLQRHLKTVGQECDQNMSVGTMLQVDGGSVGSPARFSVVRYLGSRAHGMGADAESAGEPDIHPSVLPRRKHRLQPWTVASTTASGVALTP